MTVSSRSYYYSAPPNVSRSSISMITALHSAFHRGIRSRIGAGDRVRRGRSRRSFEAMNVVCRLSSGMFLGVLVAASTAHAQGRGGGAWTTAGADAQRTSALRADAKISVASMQQPGFQFLWKRKFDSPGAPVTALTQPVLLPNIIAYKGFKALAFVGASSDTVYPADYELHRM